MSNHGTQVVLWCRTLPDNHESDHKGDSWKDRQLHIYRSDAEDQLEIQEKKVVHMTEQETDFFFLIQGSRR